VYIQYNIIYSIAHVCFTGRDAEKNNNKFARVTDLGLIKRIKTARRRNSGDEGVEKNPIWYFCRSLVNYIYTVLMKFGGRNALNHPHRPKQLLFIYRYD